MIKKIGLLLAGVVGIYALEACVLVDCTKDPNNSVCTDSPSTGGAGGNDTVSSSSGKGGAGGMGTTGGMGGMGGGTAGMGGAPACVGCAEFTTPGLGGTLCDASKGIYDAYLTCNCGASAKCAAACAKSVCMKMAPDTECSTCLADTTNGCSNEIGACNNDI